MPHAHARARAPFLLRLTLSLGAVALFTGSVACSGAPGDEAASKTDQADEIIRVFPCQPGYARLPPSVACQPTVTVEATAPEGGLECTLSGVLAVPTELAGDGCTLGATLTTDSGTFPIWACPSTVSLPLAGILAPIENPLGLSAMSSFQSTCLGSPLPGWELVSDMLQIGACPTGCPGTTPPPPPGGIKGEKE